jgi:hypothetical protein
VLLGQVLLEALIALAHTALVVAAVIPRQVILELQVVTGGLVVQAVLGGHLIHGAAVVVVA